MDDVATTTALCVILGRIPGWVWNPDDTDYPADKVGIFYGAIGTDPDRAVGVRIYGGTDDPETGLATRRAQVRFRGGRRDPAGADDLAGLAFARLQGLSRVGGINGIRRESWSPFGADTNGREERTDNYIITIDNPEVLQ